MSDTDTDSQLEAFVDDSPAEDVQKAKGMGWKDPAEWKGKPPPKGFIKAKEYIERAATVIPIIQSENKKLKEDVAEARRELKEFREETKLTVANMAKMSKVALDRQRTQLEEKHSAAIDAAVEVGDRELVRKLRVEERKDLKAFDEAAEEAKPTKEELDKANEKVNQALPKEVQDDISAWLVQNPWYHKDEDMQGVANRQDAKLIKDRPELSTTDRLDEVRKYIVKRFPKDFADEVEEDDEDEKPSRGSRVEGGSRVAGGSSGSKYSKLPADAKAQADKFIKEDGLFLEKGETVEKDMNKARERYAAAYLES